MAWTSGDRCGYQATRRSESSGCRHAEFSSRAARSGTSWTPPSTNALAQRRANPPTSSSPVSWHASDHRTAQPKGFGNLRDLLHAQLQLLDVRCRGRRVALEYMVNAGGLPCPGVKAPGGGHAHPGDLDVQRRRLSVRVVQHAPRDRKVQQVGTSEVRCHAHAARCPDVRKTNAIFIRGEVAPGPTAHWRL